MKKLLLALVIATGTALAAPYPQQDIGGVISQEGFSLDKILKIIDNMGKVVGTYPPALDSESDKKRAKDDITALSNILNLAVKKNMVKPGQPDYFYVSLSQARLGWFGHNLQMNQGGASADVAYQRAIQAAPANLAAAVKEEYGRFLTATGNLRQAETYLREAYRGDSRLGKALGLNLLAQGKLQDAQQVLQQYAKSHPKDSAVKEVLAGLQSGKIKVDAAGQIKVQ